MEPFCPAPESESFYGQMQNLELEQVRAVPKAVWITQGLLWSLTSPEPQRHKADLCSALLRLHTCMLWHNIESSLWDNINRLFDCLFKTLLSPSSNTSRCSLWYLINDCAWYKAANTGERYIPTLSALLFTVAAFVFYNPVLLILVSVLGSSIKLISTELVLKQLWVVDWYWSLLPFLSYQSEYAGKSGFCYCSSSVCFESSLS